MSEKKRKRTNSTSSTSSDRVTRSTTPSVVSVKDDASMGHPVSFGHGETQSDRVTRSTAPSVVSVKDDASMGHPVSFGQGETQRLNKDESAGFSSVSARDVPLGGPHNIGVKRLKSDRVTQSTMPSVSAKDDASMGHPVSFGHGETQSLPLTGKESTAAGVVSVKDDASMGHPVSFGLGETQSQVHGQPSSCSVCKEVLQDPVQFSCGHRSCKQCVSSDQCESAANKLCTECEKMNDGYNHLLKAKKSFQNAAQKKFSSISEGNGDQWSSLNTIYTTLIMTDAGSEGPQEEQAHRNIKQKLKRRPSSKFIGLCNIFKPLPGQEKPPRIVLTKGVAGIGKSFSVQKLVLDWAEERENQDKDFIFCLAFREMNLSTEDKSLYKLLTEFHPALHHLEDSEDLVKARVIVILDGLDESRLQLDFETKPVTSVNEVTSVGNLLSNLIQGNLLPNTNLWITSRPAAANQIPAKFVDVVTEIRGFSDPQKDEYFKKRFSQDSGLADRIISHIHSSPTLDIMCQIPIFCWISAVLFEEIFGADEKVEAPQTLTEMMAHFLFAQMKRRNRKYDKKMEDNNEKLLKTQREFLLNLGKLAFVHLQMNSLIFYDEDLENCGINIKEATIYSGFCTAVLREEEVFSQKKVFFFVHLTIQEFFAALFVYDCLINQHTEELCNFLVLKDGDHALLDLLKMTVDKVLEEKNGHLDFFLRFLLGLMLEPNRRILQGLLTSPDPGLDVDRKILTHLKAIRRKTLSPNTSINLFQTMVEMRDHKVKDEIEEYLKLSDPSKTELNPLHCSALAYMLQVSKNDLDELDLKSYRTSEEGRRRLIPAVRTSRKAILADCKVTEEWVEHLAFGLKFPFSSLRDLDLSNNDLKDSGVELLCNGLSNKCCKLKTLNLSGCLVETKGCDSLEKALKSNPSHLIHLDLSYNNPGDSGQKLLSDLRDNPQYKLSKLSFDHCGVHRMKPGFKKYACELTFDPDTAHKNLLLSDGNRKVTWMEEEQPYPHHPERFDHCQQVLCQQGLEGCCYWEVEVDEPFNVGLTYRTICRKELGNDCKLGHNDKSWSLICSVSGCYVLHANKSNNVPCHSSRSSRVGVYLDWSGGVLSFYKVSYDSRTHLYTYKEKFTGPLYPAVELHTHSSALFCQLT